MSDLGRTFGVENTQWMKVVPERAFSIVCTCAFKVHIFWEAHKIVRNLHQLFVLYTASQIIGGDFAKFCGLFRIYEFYD